MWPLATITLQGTLESSDGKTTAESTDSSVMDKGSRVSPGASIVTVEKKDEIQGVLNGGKVGLDNLGNTCYFNSSLQALVHTVPLRDYFLSDAYCQDINLQNKHGYQGRLAEGFSSLVKHAWSTKRNSLNPRSFLRVVGDLNRQFSGNEQQDAQELVTFLLDGLSEDLNLVSDKPYIEHPDSDGRPDAELADLWWGNCRKRDWSIIQALFAGQFKSLMTCSCGSTSARFEPFTILSLPIPEDSDRNIIVHVMSPSNHYALTCNVTVKKTGNMISIMECIRNMVVEGVSSDTCLLACEVINSKVLVVCPMKKKISTVRDSDNIFLYVVDALPPSVLENEEDSDSDGAEESRDTPLVPTDDTLVSIAFVHRKLRFTEKAGVETFRIEAFGLPVLVALPSQIIARDLYTKMAERLSPLLKSSIAEYLESNHDDLSVISSLKLSSAKRSLLTAAINVISPLETSSSSTAAAKGVNATSCFVPVDTVDVMGGKVIPPTGFCLRVVKGGSSNCSTCSRCPKQAQCQGCKIPQDDTLIELREMETIAIDWHYVVFKEVLDLNAVSEIRRHSSAGDNDGSSNLEQTLPLAKCLSKFTEEEKLENVCGKCLSDEGIYRGLSIWRPPPILVIQLKRFQFDNTSRRKLNNRIDFPLEGLDIAPYLAQSLQSQSQSQKDSSPCTVYDLYCVVHHIGAMNGGHYRTTVKVSSGTADDEERAEEGEGEGEGKEGSAPSLNGDWYCFDDNIVTKVQEVGEIVHSTAYVLFYMRRDVACKEVAELYSVKLRDSSGSGVRVVPPGTIVNGGVMRNIRSRIEGKIAYDVDEMGRMIKRVMKIPASGTTAVGSTDVDRSRAREPESNDICSVC